jgi:hypothetical protein
MVLLTTLGSLSIFELNGIVEGPLIAALFVPLWGIFMRDMNSVQADNKPDQS